MARSLVIIVFSFLAGFVWLRSPLQEKLFQILDVEDAFSYFGTDSVHKDRKPALQVHRRAVNDLKHLELLVVVGPDVFQLHRQDTERYILTNLNIAAELLRDPSLGAQFRVHLIRMTILTEPETDIQVTKNITSSLMSVCDWSNAINPQNDSDPQHADLVLYVTRFDLELPDGNRQVRGVTQLGGACSRSWSCLITEDTGFDLGITMAHEIAHSTGKASCVDDLPDLEGDIPGWKPGLYFGADEQCKIAFGDTASACTFSRSDVDACRVLSCHTNSADRTTCTRLLMPLLDGTECGVNKWCLRGRCISLDQLNSVAVVHGVWSSWSVFSLCSRSCGGGVTSRQRLCNNPRPAFGGQECEGPDLQASMCNIQPCSGTQLDFMAEQCNATNTQPLYLVPRVSSFYKWVPAANYAKGDFLCKHLCRGEGKNFMVSRGDSFMDGTRCVESSQDSVAFSSVCVAGSCRAFGCDGQLNSGKVMDQCMECGGDNTTCNKITGSFTEGQAKEYVTFLTLPLNSTSCHVVNQKSLFTHLAVKVEGQYVVAGKGIISLNTTYPSVLEDKQIEYKLYLTEDNLPDSEELRINGPVQDDIEIQVYRKYGKEYGDITNPSLFYSFFIPKEDQVYLWRPVIGACSVTCGEGVKSIEYMCFDQNGEEQVEHEYCLGISRPPARGEPCHLSSCPPSWVAGEFGPCNATCGGGVMERAIHCVSKERGSALPVAHSRCSKTPKPASAAPCNAEPCPVRWRVLESGRCSAICGPGTAERSVICIQTLNELDVEVEDALCPAVEKPPARVPCVVNVCPLGWDMAYNKPPQGIREDVASHTTFRLSSIREEQVYVWIPLTGNCSTSCGGGMTKVHYICVDHETKYEVKEERCDKTPKPEEELVPCNVQPCPPRWETEELVPCSATCGGGLTVLAVRCVTEGKGLTKRMPHSQCSQIPQPPSVQACNTDPCPVRWSYKADTCSVTCGEGVRHRILYCAQDRGRNEEIIADEECQGLPRPLEQEPCSMPPCPPRWKASEPGACSSVCGVGIAKRSVTCIQNHRGQDIEVSETSCLQMEKPPSLIPCIVNLCPFSWNITSWTECSVSCGNGVRVRQDICINLKTGKEVSPIFCRHSPKPITVQGCYAGPCLDRIATLKPLMPNWQEANPTGSPANGMTVHTARPVDRLGIKALPTTAAASSAVRPERANTDNTTPDSSICRKLFLSETGVLNLTGLQTEDCIFSIGAPLGEVIVIKVLYSSLNCTADESLILYERKTWLKRCTRLSGSTLNSKTNSVILRQRQLLGQNGVVLEYWKKASTSKYYQDCDMQLFGPHGEIVNPVQPYNTEQTEACRTFINVAPGNQIAIHALYIDLGPDTNGTLPNYIMIHDTGAMKTAAFHGNHLFFWQSVGSRAEIEFHGDFGGKRRFRAEYWIIDSRTVVKRSRRHA
ncbi:A disintegrin and metalloproteinase with thrombospondin motifs 13 isoform X2 [Latimeria chalumnae]|uniref:A disintegrin and metalloproteinase with thrombospondin motifs 13 isoform X2 n=1 Tax=Latimeria chalumnae TaxID=7897 RepID=UPI0003C16FF5|nr:PREDICTED: A disintegrin and metalloproteinase with thrombospondin motifs 13 isoform X2 [Latimeria chalumnae]|eukprot:XP_005990670.1 PREDICTED: A disintegrin and metalloproteinase with thrombospondin motifs 13 isoform X2 [Latimeria chalumnae]